MGLKDCKYENTHKDYVKNKTKTKSNNNKL